MATRTPRLRYHCVTVVPGRRGCDAAKALQGQRLLSADAPRLPLATCEMPGECKCTYRHHDDRREGARRARDRGERSQPAPTADRRRTYSRRATD